MNAYHARKHHLAAPLVAGVELGGTKCICVLARGPDDVRDEVRITTTDVATTLGSIARTVAGWKSRHPLASIGVASFGPLDLDPASSTYGRLLLTPKPGWSHADLLTTLRDFDVPLGLDTDVNGAALAERRWGAAHGLNDFVYITIGTGIGVGTIVAGQPIRGLGHSEAGHMRVHRRAGDDWPGACPFHGDCVEGLASGSAIAARLGRSAERLAPNDPAWNDVVHAFAGMLHNLVLTVAPERIVIGGGIAAGHSHLLPRFRSALAKSLADYSIAARFVDERERYVVAPSLGERAGPLGAVAVALHALEYGHT